MEIQANMSPKQIVEKWAETEQVFTASNIPIKDDELENILQGETLTSILIKLNSEISDAK